MSVIEEANGVFRIPVHNPFGVQPTNTYVLTGDRLALVDVGPSHRRTWEDLVRGLRSLGHGPDDVDLVVLTHGHADHDGQAYRLNRAELRVGLLDLAKVADYQAHLRRYELAVRALLPRWGVVGANAVTVPKFFARLSAAGNDAPWAQGLSDGDFLTGFDSWRVVDLPGHTEGLIGLFREADGVLISSDQLLAEIVPNPALYFALDPPGHGLTDYEQSLRRIAGLLVVLVLPGHGASFTDCAGKVAHFLEQLDVRLREAAAAVCVPSTVQDLAARLFPGCDLTNSYHVFITLVESFARLEALCERGVAARRDEGGVWRYVVRKDG